MKKTFAIFIFALTVLFATVGYNSAYAMNGFLTNPYEVLKCTFDDQTAEGLNASNINYVGSIYGRTTTSLKLPSTLTYLPENKGNYGKTSVSYSIVPGNIKGSVYCRFYGKDCSLQTSDKQLFALSFVPISSTSEAYTIFVEYNNGTSKAIAAAYIKNWLDVEVQIDTISGTCNLFINEDKDYIIYKNNLVLSAADFSNSYCLSKVEFTSESDENAVYLDDFAVRRNGSYTKDKPVIVKTKNVYEAGVEINNTTLNDKKYALLLVQYDLNNQMYNISTEETTVLAGQSKFVETFLADNDGNTGEVKAFLWSSDNISPITTSYKGITAKSGTVYDDSYFDSGFEGTHVTGSQLMSGNFAPSGWSFYNWAKPSTPIVDASVEEDEVYEGSQAVYIGPVTSGQAGWQSQRIEIPKQGIKFSYSIKTSEDYSGCRPYIFVTFFKADGSFDSKTIVQPNSTITYSSDSWHNNTYTIDPGSYPATSVYYVINLTNSNFTSSTPVGRLYFDCVEAGGITASEVSAQMYMKTDNVGNWFILGDTIKFTTDSRISPYVTEIIGDIYDSYGTKVDTVATSRDSFVNDGWNWTPKEPGYYNIEFYENVNDSCMVPIYSVVKRTDVISSTGVDFNYYLKSVIVAPTETKDISERNPKMGFSYQLSGDEYLALADKIGFGTVRIHSIPWGAEFTDESQAINTAPGVYDWTSFDQHMASIKSYGFDIVGNVLYTPRWASPHPEDDNVYITVRGFSAYAPTDMKYFEDFMVALLDRYGDDIHKWEVWNEPHLPGGSVFWSDTPEKYVELLKTAYETIKKYQPGDESEVYIGGIGARRYLSFYSEAIRLGASDYFDKIAFHGYDLDADNYNNIAVEMGYEPKEFVNTEGHYTLLTTLTSEDVYISEQRMAHRMLKYIMQEIKINCGLSTKYTVVDWNDQDVVEYADEHNIRVVSDGMFNRGNGIQPRLIASVMHNFLDEIGKTTTFKSEMKFNDDQQGVVLTCNDKDVAIVWSVAAEDKDANATIKGLITSESVITDWEGKTYTTDTFVMKPYTMYYITNLNATALKSIPNAKDEVIYSEYAISKNTDTVPESAGVSFPVFNHDSYAVDENVVWTNSGFKWNGNTYTSTTYQKPTNYDVKFAVGGCDDGVDFVIDITDDYNNYYTSNTTKNDSVILGIDTLGNGIMSDRMVFSLTWDQNLNASLVKIDAPSLDGNLVPNWTSENEEVAHKNIHIEKNGNLTRIYLHIAKSEMYPYFKTTYMPLRMNLSTVNYDNGTYKGFYEWGSGMLYTGGRLNGNITSLAYGRIIFPTEPTVNIDGNNISVSGKTEPDMHIAFLVMDENQNFAYIAQGESDAEGNYSFNFPISRNGEFTIILSGTELEYNIVSKFEK